MNVLKESKLTNLVMIASISGIIIILSWVLWFSQYGFDFTDEGYYLAWISNPFIYSISVTQFGFIYHPLYNFLNGDISGLRQANILITYLLAWILCNLYLKKLFSKQVLKSHSRYILSASFATASLIDLYYWLPTPSYNTLAFQSLLIAATALLVIGKKQSKSDLSGWFLLGVGGWLAFMAKPTTAIMLGVFSLLYLFLSGKLRIKFILISLSVALFLLVVSAFMIDGSVMVFIERLKAGVQTGVTLGSGHTFSQLIRFDALNLTEKDGWIFVSCVLLVFLSTYLLTVKRSLWVSLGLSISLLFFLCGLIVIFNLTPLLGKTHFFGFFIWSLPLTALIISLLTCNYQGIIGIQRNKWILLVTFILFPYIYSFGTNTNFWRHGSSSAIFWLLAGLIFLIPLMSKISNNNLISILFSFGLATQLIIIILIQTGMNSPYRQPSPIYENKAIATIGNTGSTLIIDETYNHYILKAKNKLIQAGFEKGMPIIDLTGRSPGLLYAIGATNIGQPWMIGGYKGSEALAAEMLAKVSCKNLSAAWLIQELGKSPARKLSPTILTSFGALIKKDYKIVGEFKTASGAGGYTEQRKQEILKPTRSVDEAISVCVKARKQDKQ